MLVQNLNESLILFSQIVEQAYNDNNATFYPEPEDKEEFVRSQMYSTDYESFLLDSYSWPEDAMTIQTAKL